MKTLKKKTPHLKPLMNRLRLLLALICLPGIMSATTYYVATDGSDKNAGTIDAPFATLRYAQGKVSAGDTIYFRGGTYTIGEDQIMDATNVESGLYAVVYKLTKSGTSDSQRICYFGYPGERPIFDFSGIKPDGQRVSAFFVTGSYLYFKNFDIIGVQVTISGDTQSECIYNRGGSNNIYENLAMHDGMGIGFYLTAGSDNLVLNCDAYNNYDEVSGSGGNVDGFGAHPTNAKYTGNVFRGCRAWWNSDDGFDLINSFAAVTIENCWAFYNGYQPGSTSTVAGDGTGIKAGGYGMGTLDESDVPTTIPRHVVRNSIAYYNYYRGFYSNHHLGGVTFEYNTSYQNPRNYEMTNRKSVSSATDVDGYDHIIQHNVSYSPRISNYDIINVDETACTIVNNSFLPTALTLSDADFTSLEYSQLWGDRQSDGSLPEITFLVPASTSALYTSEIGYTFGQTTEETTEEEEEESTEEETTEETETADDTSWQLKSGIRIDGTTAIIEGPDASSFTTFYVDGTAVTIGDDYSVDLSAYSGTVELKATTKTGIIMTRKVTLSQQ